MSVPETDEPAISINGRTLSPGQAMTVRCGIESFASFIMADGLGDDEHGHAMVAAHLARINEIRRMIFHG